MAALGEPPSARVRPGLAADITVVGRTSQKFLAVLPETVEQSERDPTPVVVVVVVAGRIREWDFPVSVVRAETLPTPAFLDRMERPERLAAEAAAVVVVAEAAVLAVERRGSVAPVGQVRLFLFGWSD